MKKFLTLFLAVSTVVALSACEGSGTKDMSYSYERQAPHTTAGDTVFSHRQRK